MEGRVGKKQVFILIKQTVFIVEKNRICFKSSIQLNKSQHKHFLFVAVLARQKSVFQRFRAPAGREVFLKSALSWRSFFQGQMRIQRLTFTLRHSQWILENPCLVHFPTMKEVLREHPPKFRGFRYDVIYIIPVILK